MNKYFSEQYDLKMLETEQYVDEISKVTYEYTTLYIIVSTSKRISDIESILDLVSSKEDRLSLMYTQTELLNINKQLSKNLPYKIGYGKKAIRIDGLLKLIKFGNYDKALKIVENLADIQPIKISEEMEAINKICFHKDIYAVKEAFVNSWINVKEESTKVVACPRPNCGIKRFANEYPGDRFCHCGATVDLVEVVDNSQANYIPLYAKYILGYLNRNNTKNTAIKKVKRYITV